MCLPPIITAIKKHMIAEAENETPFYIFKYALLSKNKSDVTRFNNGKELSREQTISLKKFENAMKQALGNFCKSREEDLKPATINQAAFNADRYKNFIAFLDDACKRIFKKKVAKPRKEKVVWKTTRTKEETVEDIIAYLDETKNNEFIILAVEAIENNKSKNYPNLWQNINAHKLNHAIKTCLISAGKKIEISGKERKGAIQKNYPRFVDLFCKDFKAKYRTQNDIVIEACTYEAVIDLVTGNLHKLDPVIKDAGCQWRVPFVVDLYHAVTTHIKDKYKIDGIEQEYKDAWKRLGNPSLVSFTHRKNNHVLNATNETGAANAKKLNYIDISELKLFRPFFEDVSDFIKKWNSEALETTPDGLRAHYSNAKYAQIQFTNANALDYLMICKALTINHIRSQDAFGLGGITVETTPPVTGSKYAELGGRLAWYSRAYMIHIANAVKNHKDEMSGVESDNDEEDLKEEEEAAPVTETTMADTLAEILSTPRWYFPFESNKVLTHSFYEPLRLLFMYLYFRKIPLILDMKRTICSGKETPEYKFSGGGVYFFRPDNSLRKFVYVPVDKLKDSDKNTVGFCIDAFSMAQKGQPLDGVEFALEEKYDTFIHNFLTQCDIVDQILVSAFPHPSHPNDTKYLEESDDKGSEYTDVVPDTLVELRKKASVVLEHNSKGKIRSLLKPALNLLGGDNSDYGPEWNIVAEVETLKSLCQKIGYDRVGYRTGSGDSRTRMAGTVLFAPIHIYGCTFAIKEMAYTRFLKTNPDVVKGQEINANNCNLLLG